MTDHSSVNLGKVDTTIPESSGVMKSHLNAMHYLLLVIVALAFFLPGTLTMPPTDRDESRFAQASHQMLETGDYVDIRFQDQARYKKPVGIYWLQSAAASLTIGTEKTEIWAYRLPSLISAVLIVLLTAAIGQRLFSAPVGMTAGLVMCAVLVLGVEARQAKTDATLVMTIILAQLALAQIYMDYRQGREMKLGPALLFWLAQGLGLLIKGPIGLLVSGGTILFLIGRERKLGWLKRLAVLRGLPLMVLPVLPWLIAIGIKSDGAFFGASVGHELLGKVYAGQESHGAPPGYYLIAFWLTFWPFTLLAGWSLPWIWRNRHDDAVAFLVAWILPTWIVFELVVTKLPHYVLPVYPAIAILIAKVMQSAQEAGEWPLNKVAYRLPQALFLLITAVLGFGIPVLFIIMEGTVNPWSLIGALGALVPAWFVLTQGRDLAPRRLFALLLGGSFLVYACTFQWTLPGMKSVWLSPAILNKLEEVRFCPDQKVVSSGYSEPSLVFLVGTDLLLAPGAEAARFLKTNPDCGIAVVTQQEQGGFDRTAAELGLSVSNLGRVSGFNYAKGKNLQIHFYRLSELAQ